MIEGFYTKIKPEQAFSLKSLSKNDILDYIKLNFHKDASLSVRSSISQLSVTVKDFESLLNKDATPKHLCETHEEYQRLIVMIQ